MKIDEPLSIQIFDKTNQQFIYFQLLLHCLLQIKCNDNDQDELITLLEKEYETNGTQLDIIHEFQEEYSSEKVLWWYTRHSFLNRILHKALNVRNIQMIFLLRGFISDLYLRLKQHQPKCRLQVFRSQILSNQKLDNLKENLRQLISISSFWAANTDRSKALADTDQFKASSDLQRVLFEIAADPTLTTTKPFALIDASEVLFMAASVFRLTEITRQDDQVWIIKMTLCTDVEYNSMFDSIKIQPENENESSNLRLFAKILWKIDQLDLANRHYNRLINELPSDDPLLMIVYDDLGTMALEKKNYDAGVQYYTKSIAIKNQNLANTVTGKIVLSGKSVHALPTFIFLI